MLKRLLIGLLLITAVLPLLGCPGNTKADKEANVALEEWILAQDENGWEIPGWENTSYTNIIVEYEFKPTRLEMAIHGDQVNPMHQRNIQDNIAMTWYDLYPANMKPRFTLTVKLYDEQIGPDFELGYTEIDAEGNPSTHHHATHDVN